MPFRKIASLFILLFFCAVAAIAQVSAVAVSGTVRDRNSKEVLPYANVVLQATKDSAFVMGTVSNQDGNFSLSGIKPGNYFLTITMVGFTTQQKPLFVGSLSEYLKVPAIELEQANSNLEDVTVTAKVTAVSSKMDRKTYAASELISNSGGSVLQTLQTLPGITLNDGKVQLRGSDRIIILIDGKQTALTGFGSQSGLDNLPASSIDKIEIINNPSARYDANGNAGIINIVLKKNKQEGFNGKVGLVGGLGALWVKQDNLPDIRPQYTATPKINPSLSINFRKHHTNVFLQADDLYTETLNKNEFVTRTYDDGTVIKQQLKRNRNTNFLTAKTGVDWYIDPNNSLTVSGLFGSEKIIDRGDQPFYNSSLTQRLRLWQFLEDELKTTVMATASYQHKFKQAGQVLNAGFIYTFHRENEKYFYDNYLPASKGVDSFKLLSDEQVYDFNLDYSMPLRYGRIETGIKLRNRSIPTNMHFQPGNNSVLDSNAGGWANYKELIPALYGNYVLEKTKWEMEAGLRVEYVRINYDVNPNHNTYESSGYHYTQPFPNLRLAYKLNAHNKISFFYNRRVDRPNEVDIRIFPKYDDAGIIKVGNPALKPQFTNALELAFKTSWENGSFYTGGYYRFADATITRISTTVPNSDLIFAIFQNAGKSHTSGLEFVWSQTVSKHYSLTMNANVYYNQIDSFTVENLYPVPHPFTAATQSMYSGNVKMVNNFHLPRNYEAQLSATYLAPDIIPQGKMHQRFSLDMGIKKTIQKGKGELLFNATDLLNTMVTKKDITGNGFVYTSADYNETQVFRLGYSYKF